MLIYVNITDRQTDRQTDRHIKTIVRNLTKLFTDRQIDGRTTQNCSSEPHKKTAFFKKSSLSKDIRTICLRKSSKKIKIWLLKINI